MDDIHQFSRVGAFLHSFAKHHTSRPDVKSITGSREVLVSLKRLGTGYIICEAHCKMKEWSVPCEKSNNFKMVTEEH